MILGKYGKVDGGSVYDTAKIINAVGKQCSFNFGRNKK